MTDSPAHPFDRPDDAAIARYLSGSASPGEQARIERWAAADPANEAELAALQTAWNPLPVAEADPDDHMWRWITGRMDEALPPPKVVRPAQTGRPAFLRIGAIAAALVALAGGALLLRLPRQPRPAVLRPGVEALRGEMQELVTPRRARATSNLPDGSRIILGPESRLRVPATYAAAPWVAGTRDVYLEGEAFFEVTHDAKRPFRVHTANGIVEDLGTAFTVTAYPETGGTRAVVVSGVVALRSRAATDSGLTLRAGDLGRVDAAGALTRTRNVNLASYVGWTTGDLVFNETPLQEAIAVIDRWYDLDVHVADATLMRRRFTARFHDDPDAEVFRVLQLALGVRVERDGRSVTLRPMHERGSAKR